MNFLTHLEKIYWPKEKITKGDLINYYVTISKILLPHIKDRPMMMHRFPNGIQGKEFFQKDAPKFTPNWVKTISIHHHHKEEPVHYILIQNLKTLLYVVNLGTIELHPFLSRVKKLDYPDYLVLDLDPENMPFKYVIQVAQCIHTLLKKLQVQAYCKTSGKRGLHIFIPLAAKYTFEESRICAELLANFAHQAIPELSSVIRNPAKRQKKVYIDFLQNSATKSVVAPYSVRPVAGAMVSTPIEWSEVTEKLDPTQFTIKTVPERVERIGDIFKPTLGKGINMKQLIQKLEKL